VIFKFQFYCYEYGRKESIVYKIEIESVVETDKNIMITKNEILNLAK
jgi:hypothetical protein